MDMVTAPKQSAKIYYLAQFKEELLQKRLCRELEDFIKDIEGKLSQLDDTVVK